MSWASKYIEQLKAGETVEFRPRGNSMTGRIESGNLVKVVPVDRQLEKGDIVLCKVNGRQYLHLIKAISGDRIQISNNHGHINGWTSVSQIYGICVKVSK